MNYEGYINNETQLNINNLTQRLTHLIYNLNQKITNLSDEYKKLNIEIQILIESENDLRLREANFKNKQVELEKIEKKLKEKTTMKLEFSRVIECYSDIIRNSQEILSKKVDEITRRKVELLNKEVMISKFVEERSIII